MDHRLTGHDIEQFVHLGYIRLDNAFSREVGDQVRDILWKEMGLSPNEPTSWTRPVVRLGMYNSGPFVEASNTPVLHEAFDQLVGAGRWYPCRNMGTFPIRFPSADDPGDTGWHVDASFPGNEPNNYMEWRINVRSRGRALLMLFLFSDVSEADAPTRIREGSHLDVARALAPAGETGLSFMEVANELAKMPQRSEVLATGSAGTVYLCHPFIAHAAQPHRGTMPRFLAQPPLILKEELVLDRPKGDYSPVEKAVLMGLGNA